MPIFRDETQPENHLERSIPLSLQPTSQDAEVQRKRMLIALGILLLALAAVVLKDWDFWFPPSGEMQEATVRSKSKRTTVAAPTASTPATPAREQKPAKPPEPTAAEAPSRQPPSARRCLLSRWKSWPETATSTCPRKAMPSIWM